jgi:predicted dehydrogenase
MGKERIRWGVLSTANIGRVAVIPAIEASTNGELVAVASRDDERAGAFASALGIPRAHSSYEALLADNEVDALYIPLPNSMHLEWTAKAVAAGKHVLCEKPLALDEAECHEMAAAAQRAGVTLMEAFMYRFHPRTARVLELIQGDAIGPLRVVRSSFSFRLRNPDNIRMKPELGGGSLMDVGCYCVNVSRTLAGAEPVEVQAFASWGNHLDVSAAFLPGVGDTIIEEHHGREASQPHTIPGTDEYQLMVEHFADCVLYDRPVRYPPAEAAANMRTIEALYRSARNGGRPETV